MSKEIYQLLEECQTVVESPFVQEVLEDLRESLDDHGRLSTKQVHQLRTLHRELFE